MTGSVMSGRGFWQDYGVKENPTKDLVLTGTKSKLHPRVINLMRMLFDIETYK
jgi:poly [ADP-ribose] polymerase